MMGRYGAVRGVDKLGWFLFAVSIVLTFIGNLCVSKIAVAVFNVLSFAAFVYFIFRFFSKNIYARQKENDRFMGVFGKVKGFFRLQKDRFKDRKTHVYKKCPHCKAVIRLPRKKGKNSVICPKCRERFYVNNIF